MFRKLIKNKKAQNTAEYAILISLVVAGIIAMQTYAQRALQARVRDASVYLSNQTGDLGNTLQYEPYYLTTNYNVTSTTTDAQNFNASTDGMSRSNLRTREGGGFQQSSYNQALQAGQGGT